MDYNDIILNFTSIIYEALPFVVLGVIIAGILEEFVPQTLLSGIFQGKLADHHRSRFTDALQPALNLLRFRIVAIALGGLLGLLFPMCECGIIAIMRRLIRKGVPLSVCISYMLAGPIINIVVMLSTYVAFNTPQEDDYVFNGPMNVVLLRAGMGFVVAVVASIIVNRQYQKHGDALLDPSLIAVKREGGPENDGAAPAKRRLSQRLGSIAETSLHDFIDIMAFLVLGAALAAVGRESIDNSDLQTRFIDSPALSILLMMGIAVLFCLCSEADAFVAANFAAALPPAAKMAFMVLGPMMDLKLYVMYTRIFRQRLIWTIILAVAIQVLIYSLALHYLWGHLGENFTPGGYPKSYLERMGTAVSPT